MKILIIGFQRSGTTLLRRIIQVHPQVRRIFHEHFLLNKYNKVTLQKFLEKYGVDFKNDTWGEKCPYYPNIRKNPVIKYCEKWNEYFGKESRIIHIVRHPYDVTFSIMKKNKNVKKFDIPVKMYCSKLSKTVPEILNLKNTITIKYENLLQNSEVVVPLLYDFCGLDKDVDFRKLLLRLRNPKYQTINTVRAFDYRNKNVNTQVDLTDVLNIINKIDGPKYEDV